jgi:hypothetical protein
MNFTLNGLPGTALVLIVFAAALVTSAPFVVKRLMRSGGPVTDTKLTGTKLTGTKRTVADVTVAELKVQ